MRVKIYSKSHEKKIESTFSQITRIFPRRIHAVTSKGFEIKVFNFILSYTFYSAPSRSRSRNSPTNSPWRRPGSKNPTAPLIHWSWIGFPACCHSGSASLSLSIRLLSARSASSWPLPPQTVTSASSSSRTIRVLTFDPR